VSTTQKAFMFLFPFIVGMSCAAKWLSKDVKYLERQELWMRIFCMAPFLFRCKDILPGAWISALIHAKLLNKNRQV